MHTLDFLQKRASIPARYLKDPAPNAEQLSGILTAGLAAPDHAALRPWRFIEVSGDARHALATVFTEAALMDNPDTPADKLERIAEKPLRSPLIIVVVATLTPDHPKTPELEQILSAGAATQQIMLAANAMGFGAVWLTGPNATHPHVKAALNVSEKDEIVGFVYLGTSSIKPPTPKRPSLDEHFTQWQGPQGGR